jgi:drug/metabolite transporter (DMT)-like permease
VTPDITPFAAGTVLLSAVLHAGWNATLKQRADKGAASALMGALSVPLALLAGWAFGAPRLPLAGLPWVLVCAAVEVLYFVSLTVALHHLPLGSAYGLSRGLGLLLVWPASHLIFGEALGAQDIAGVSLLAGGLFTLAQGAPSLRGVALAALCGATIAIYPLSYKQALSVGVDPYALYAASLGLSVPGQLVALGPARWERVRACWHQDAGPILLSAILCAASFLLFLGILTTHGPGRVTALRNASVVFALGFSMVAGQERTWRDLACALAVSLGCVLIAS